jgi:4-hydroxybenzoate polyprenyltransferase
MGFLGNFMVSGCIAIPFIFGSLIINSFSINNLFFASMAFLSNAGREVTKGIVDVSGDNLHKVRTVAVIWGEKKAAHVASILYLCAVILSIVPWALGLVSMWYPILVTITDIGFIVTSISLVNIPSRENARKKKRLVLIWMILALLAFLMGNQKWPFGGLVFSG